MDKTYTVFAGKLRRYYGESWLQRLLDIKTNLLNLRDFIFVSIGILQSIIVLLRTKPDVIFVKGGYVGLPVGIAASFLHIPFITHDSDILPGLTNRVVGRWAKMHLTGMPEELYKYPRSKTKYVGVPISDDFTHISSTLQDAFKKQLGYKLHDKIILVIGGSLGAKRINEIMIHAAPKLLEQNEKINIIHQTGKQKERLYPETYDRVKSYEFINDVYKYMGAADVVISRAGANTIAELAREGKSSVIIPNPYLTGGHQVKNAEELRNEGAAIVLDEAETLRNPRILVEEVTNLLANSKLRESTAQKLHSLSKPNAAKDIAKILIENAR